MLYYEYNFCLSTLPWFIHIECGLLSTAIKDSFNNLIITYLLSDVAIDISETKTWKKKKNTEIQIASKNLKRNDVCFCNYNSNKIKKKTDLFIPSTSIIRGSKFFAISKLQQTRGF